MIHEKPLELGRMFSRVCRLRARLADQHFEQIGLYRGQAILLILLEQDEGVTHSEIAEKLDISQAAASKVIKRLEKSGYLQRRPDSNDERISRLYLQEKGRTIISEIRSSFRRVDATSFQGFSRQELITLVEMLTRIQTNIAVTHACAPNPSLDQNLPK